MDYLALGYLFAIVAILDVVDSGGNPGVFILVSRYVGHYAVSIGCRVLERYKLLPLSYVLCLDVCILASFAADHEFARCVGCVAVIYRPGLNLFHLEFIFCFLFVLQRYVFVRVCLLPINIKFS